MFIIVMKDMTIGVLIDVHYLILNLSKYVLSLRSQIVNCLLPATLFCAYDVTPRSPCGTFGLEDISKLME